MRKELFGGLFAFVVFYFFRWQPLSKVYGGRPLVATLPPRHTSPGVVNSQQQTTKFLDAIPHFFGTLAKMAGAPYFVAQCAHVRVGGS